MNTGISFNQAVNAFVVVCDTMFFYLGISPQEISDSPYYNSFFAASYNVASVMARSPIYTGKVKALCSNGYYDEDDIIHMLTLQIVRKYTAIIIAMSKNGDKMDLKNYTSAIVRNALISWLRGITDNTEDETSVVSLNVILDSDDHTTLLDKQQSEDPTPEEHVIDAEISEEAIRQVYSYMKLLSKHSSRGQLFALVFSCLEDEDDIIAKEVEDKIADICNENENMFWVIYNMLLLRYAKSIGMDRSLITEFMAFDVSEFGRSFSSANYKDFPAYISRGKYLVKQELAKLLDIDLGPKQVRKK